MSNLYVISGVTGMTGNELARQLIVREDEVIGFDNLYASSIDTIRDCFKHPKFRFFEYDINNENQMNDIKRLVLGKKRVADQVIYINCAAVVHTEHFYHVNETFDTNVLGMRSFLQQAIEVGAGVFINCSTSEIYSMASYNETGGVRESDYTLLANAEHSQRTSYAVGKMMTEFFMRDVVSEKKILGCSIRFANVYSMNELMPKHIIPYILTSLMKNGKVTLLENSRVNKRSFLHNIDSCSAVLALADHQNALDGSVYNVATDEEVSIIELVKICAEKLKLQNPEIRFEGYRQSDPQRRMLCTDKIRKATGWKPVITLSQGLDLCVQSYFQGKGVKTYESNGHCGGGDGDKI